MTLHMLLCVPSLWDHWRLLEESSVIPCFLQCEINHVQLPCAANYIQMEPWPERLGAESNLEIRKEITHSNNRLKRGVFEMPASVA